MKIGTQSFVKRATKCENVFNDRCSFHGFVSILYICGRVKRDCLLFPISVSLHIYSIRAPQKDFLCFKKITNKQKENYFLH